MTTIVRPVANEEELRVAAAFAVRLLHATLEGGGFSPRRVLAEDPEGTWLETARGDLESGRGQVLMALDGDRVVGFLAVGLHVQSPLYEMREVARITSVFVEEDHSGRGIAGHLVHEAARWAREKGASVLSLTTPFDNVAARFAWSALGFQEWAIVMEKVLPETVPPFEETRRQARVLRREG